MEQSQMWVFGVQSARAFSVGLFGIAIFCSCVAQHSNVSAAPTGTVFFVAPLSTSCDPDDPGSGTIEDPWTNPYYALTRGGLQPGDTLQLRGGTYIMRSSAWSRR